MFKRPSNPLLQRVLPLALALALPVQSVSCSVPAVEQVQTTVHVNSLELYNSLRIGTAEQRAAVNKKLALMSISQFYSLMVALASDGTYVVDGHVFTNGKQNLIGQKDQYLALGKKFKFVGEFWQATGYNPNTFSYEAFSSALGLTNKPLRVSALELDTATDHFVTYRGGQHPSATGGVDCDGFTSANNVNSFNLASVLQVMASTPPPPAGHPANPSRPLTGTDGIVTATPNGNNFLGYLSSSHGGPLQNQIGWATGGSRIAGSDGYIENCFELSSQTHEYDPNEYPPPIGTPMSTGSTIPEYDDELTTCTGSAYNSFVSAATAAAAILAYQCASQKGGGGPGG